VGSSKSAPVQAPQGGADYTKVALAWDPHGGATPQGSGGSSSRQRQCGILQSSTSAGSSKAMWAQAPPRRRGLLQGSAVAGSSRQRGLLQGNGCTGMGSSKAAVGWPDGGLESRPDGPRSGLGRFFIFEN
jgi:hypothetical protein